MSQAHILALAGGVGGAKFANGLAACLPVDALTIVVNTGDDFEHLGLHISPDIDSVLYALAGLNDPVRGWGLAGETWQAMHALARLGAPDWFALGDQDLATHLVRSERLRAGESLSTVTAMLAARLGIAQRIVPMSDDPIRSMIHTDEGILPFQEYFVRRRCEPVFQSIEFAGIDSARPAPGLMAALDDPHLHAILLCPSNPVLSLRPILSLPGIAQHLRARRVPVVAVSPLIGGHALKGPTAKILTELGIPVTPGGLLACYDGLIDALVIDRRDGEYAASLPCPALVTDTLMRDVAGQARLAREVLEFAAHLPPERT